MFRRSDKSFEIINPYVKVSQRKNRDSDSDIDIDSIPLDVKTEVPEVQNPMYATTI